MTFEPDIINDPVVIVDAFADLPDPPMTLKERSEKLIAAHRLIQTRYEAGVPFFTKDMFADIVHQFERVDSLEQKFSVTGLDGVAVHFPLQTGREYFPHPYGDDCICIITKPRLLYHTIENLLNDKFSDIYGICHGLLPVQVIHTTEVRNSRNNELVDLWPSSDYITVKQNFEQVWRTLGSSEKFGKLKATLASITIPPNICKVVALACSTMTWTDKCYRSMAQHALALMMRDFLSSGHANGSKYKLADEIKCYAQDPIYTPIDEKVLGETGFTIVDDPRAFLQVDDSSVVIAVSPDIPVRQIIADIARPAILIWDKVIVKDRSILWTDPVSPRVEQMAEEYIELPFPIEDEAFQNMAIYIRKATANTN